jgi:perosamine synthetase
MKTILINQIVKSVEKVIGKGPRVLHQPMFGSKEKKYLNQTIEENFVSSKGMHTIKFERKIKKYTKSKFSIAVTSGTEAIYIALLAAGIKKNHEVLVPSLTFIGTVNAISYLGSEPHFIDSNIRDFGVDAPKLEKYLKEITRFKDGKTYNRKTNKIISAIVPVHVFGQPCAIDKILLVAKKFNLIVIEDAAEGLGSSFKNKHVGTFGKVGCLSFNGNKIITTGGGGAIITNNKKIANKIHHLVCTAKKKHKWEFDHDEIGYNLRMPSLNAALGLAQIEKINIFVKAKRKLFENYSKAFKKVNGAKIFKENNFTKSNYWLQTLILDKKKSNLKNKILKKFHEKKIMSRPAWKLISDLKPYKKKQKMPLQGAKEIYSRVINLPSSQKIIL